MVWTRPVRKTRAPDGIFVPGPPEEDLAALGLRTAIYPTPELTRGKKWYKFLTASTPLLLVVASE
jgi:hypothetical protein